MLLCFYLQEEYDRLRPISYTNVGVIVMCFAIDAPDSLDNISDKWAPEIKQFCPETPVVLVGMKTDLRSNKDTWSRLGRISRIPVTSQQGQDIGRKIRAYKYVECSAKSNEGVRELFKTATRAALYGGRKKNMNSIKNCMCNIGLTMQGR